MHPSYCSAASPLARLMPIRWCGLFVSPSAAYHCPLRIHAHLSGAVPIPCTVEHPMQSIPLHPPRSLSVSLRAVVPARRVSVQWGLPSAQLTAFAEARRSHGPSEGPVTHCPTPELYPREEAASKDASSAGLWRSSAQPCALRPPDVLPAFSDFPDC